MATYTFAYFIGNGETGMYLAHGTDGLHFTAAKDAVPVLKSRLGAGLIRDPFLFKTATGRWAVVWTVAWQGTSLGIAFSHDLQHWTEPREVPIMAEVAGTENVWAPKLAFDAATGHYILIWSSTVAGRFPETQTTAENKLNHRIYYATSPDLEHFSAPQLLWDPGFSTIDGLLTERHGRWWLIAKNETAAPIAAKYLFLASSRTPTGPFAMLSPRITGDFWAEGPALVPDEARWVVLFDRYMDGRWGAVTSTDGLTWTDMSDQIALPAGARHGSIVRIA